MNASNQQNSPPSPLLHICRLALRWGDMDAMGHVNNTVYFRYMEQARIEWLEQIDFTFDPAGDGPVIVHTECTFLKQLVYPCEIEVRSYLGVIGRSSFEVNHEIYRVDMPEIIHASGGAKLVWVNFAAAKSTRLPEDFREKLMQSAAPGVSRDPGDAC